MFSYAIIIFVLTGTLAAPQTQTRKHPLPSVTRIESLKNNLTELGNKLEERSAVHITKGPDAVHELPSITHLKIVVADLKKQNIGDCSNLLKEKISAFAKFALEHRMANHPAAWIELREKVAKSLEVAGDLYDKISHHRNLCEEKGMADCKTGNNYMKKLKDLADDIKTHWTDYENSHEVKIEPPVHNELLNQVEQSIVHPVEDCIISKLQGSTTQGSDGIDIDGEESCEH